MKNKIYWRLPLKLEDNYIVDSNYRMTAMFNNEVNIRDVVKSNVIDLLNGVDTKPIIDYNLSVKDEVEILNDNKLFIIVRGYGHLSSRYGDDKACEIQDKYIEYIIEKLSKNE